VTKTAIPSLYVARRAPNRTRTCDLHPQSAPVKPPLFSRIAADSLASRASKPHLAVPARDHPSEYRKRSDPVRHRSKMPVTLSRSLPCASVCPNSPPYVQYLKPNVLHELSESCDIEQP